MNPKFKQENPSGKKERKKKLPTDATDVRDAGPIPGPGRSLEGGRCNLPQDSCLESPVDRGPWRATVHGVTESWAWLKRLSMHARSMKTVFKVLKLIIYPESP